MKTILVLALFLAATSGWAQGRPENDGHEIQLWTGGGRSVTGNASGSGVWNAGLRYGWILSSPHGPGFLKGRLEYAVDAVPIFWVVQPQNTAYGFGLNPLNLKWNFSTRGRIVPFIELSGGTFFSNREVPAGTSKTNFTSGGAIGVHILRGEYNGSIELRYMHISNAGLTSPNPGMNTIQVRLGLGMFLPGKEGRKHHRSRP
jgi:hypothetical protein